MSLRVASALTQTQRQSFSSIAICKTIPCRSLPARRRGKPEMSLLATHASRQTSILPTTSPETPPSMTSCAAYIASVGGRLFFGMSGTTHTGGGSSAVLQRFAQACLSPNRIRSLWCFARLPRETSDGTLSMVGPLGRTEVLRDILGSTSYGRSSPSRPRASGGVSVRKPRSRAAVPIPQVLESNGSRV